MKCPSPLPKVLGTSSNQLCPIWGVCLDSWCHQHNVAAPFTCTVCHSVTKTCYSYSVEIYWFNRIFIFFLLCVHQFYWECWHFSVYISVRGKSSVLQMAAFRATMWLFSAIWGRSLNFAPSVGPDYTPPLNSSEGEVYWCIWLWCKGQLSHEGRAGQRGTRGGTWMNGAKIL